MFKAKFTQAFINSCIVIQYIEKLSFHKY